MYMRLMRLIYENNIDFQSTRHIITFICQYEVIFLRKVTKRFTGYNSEVHLNGYTETHTFKKPHHEHNFTWNHTTDLSHFNYADIKETILDFRVLISYGDKAQMFNLRCWWSNTSKYTQVLYKCSGLLVL